MRYSDRNSSFDSATQPHAGALLVAHPHLLDPHFRRSIVLLSIHSDEEGSLGVIVNRPLNQTLGQYESELSDTSLSSVPLFNGGPVAKDQLILAAWKWVEEEGTFRFFFGIDTDRAQAIVAEDPEFQLRGFLGHAGWGEGQLESEMEQGSWVLSGRLHTLASVDTTTDWHDTLCAERPELRLLADAPDDPSLN